MEKRTLRLILLLSLALVLLAGAPRSASACSCAAKPSVAAAKDSAAAVFAGTVAKTSGGGGGINGVLGLGDSVTFRVQRSWKGVSTQSVGLRVAPGGSAACEYEYQQGQAYLVYASPSSDNPDGPLRTNTCSRTVPLAAAGDDLRLLGPATIALRPVSGVTVHAPMLIIGLGMAAVFACAVLFIGWASRRRARG
jgi:hypothetical protein